MASSDKTTNYLLNKFSGGDYWKRTDWNADMEIIDGELKKLSDSNNYKTDTGYTNGGALLGLTEILSDYQYYDGNGDWYKLKSDTTSPYTHDATDTPDTEYLELITHKSNLEKIEDLYTENLERTILFSGSHSSTGILALSDNWDNYDKILVVALSSTYGNMVHTVFYTSEIVGTDSTSSDTSAECTVYGVENVGYMSCNFRDTNRDEIYITQVSGTPYIKKIIGIGYIGG